MGDGIDKACRLIARFEVIVTPISRRNGRMMIIVVRPGSANASSIALPSRIIPKDTGLGNRAHDVLTH